MAIDRENLREENVVARFYKIILGWDFLRLLKDCNNRSKDVGNGAGFGLQRVKDTYEDEDDYFATYEPLLFEEAKAQIVQGKDDEQGPNAEEKGVVASCVESDGFHLLEFAYQPKHEESISQNDLLLLSKEKFELGAAKLPTTYAFALVEHRQRRDEGLTVLRLRTYLAGEVMQNIETFEYSPRLLNMRSIVTSGSVSLYILKMCSLSTIAREYTALRSISSLPFKDLIFNAVEFNHGSQDEAWKISTPLQEYIKSNLNKSQQEAVNAGLSKNPFILIQGPPGTGKTQTILGILSAILHAVPGRVHSRDRSSHRKRGPALPLEEKYNHWGQASPWLIGVNPRDIVMPIDGDDGFFPTTGNELRPEVVTSRRKYRTRVLVCAPSNSALDEIVLRILNTGVRDEKNQAYYPKIVRIGLKAHHSVKSVSMDYLVDQKLATHSGHEKQKHGASGRDSDDIRAAVLEEAVIVFSTLSFSGSTVFSKLNRGFDVVIIDEAAQAIEPATLVPLANGCKQVYLVGDPVQLPATVISPVAEKFGYGMSLFKRLQKAGYPVQMLKTQYRMHPEVRSFPSREFYDEALEDGPDIVAQTERAWHKYRCFGPFCFFDIHEGQESEDSSSGSWVNVDEVEFVIQMYHKLIENHPELKSSSRFAIISPYRQQVKLFQDRFKQTFGAESDKYVDITTVDGCQGREKDVAIFSCVRASKDRGIGFLADFRRMNVGITRARSSILVVGSATTLKKDEHWKNLVENAETRNCLFKVSKPYDSFYSRENLDTMKAKEDELPDSIGSEDELGDHVASYPTGDVNDIGFGDGDMDMDMDGGYEED